MNTKHREILLSGVTEWNEWRKLSVEVPDLRDADLRNTVLSGADLNGADLKGAKLRWTTLWTTKLNDTDLTDAELDHADLLGASILRANLTGAILVRAKLFGADLTGANLTGANLLRINLHDANLTGANLTETKLFLADLTGANLTGANLTGADLIAANFLGANLFEANLTNAKFAFTRLSNVDLSVARNLESTRHLGPSTVGTDTIYLSRGRIPEAFLSGAGVPDALIAYIPSMLGKGIEFYSCFISYIHKDEEFAQRLFSELRDNHLRVWFAPEDSKITQLFGQQIEEPIRHDKHLLVISDQSITSEWFIAEIFSAREREVKENRRLLFPIRLMDNKALEEWTCVDPVSGKDLAVELRQYFIPDFSRWKDHDHFQRAFKRLLQDLRNSENDLA